MPDSQFRVLIVGCGQLGSRHLQAVASLTSAYCIEVVDPRPEALQLGRDRLHELGVDRLPEVRWLQSLDDATDQSDLCIVATQAEGRCEIVQSVSKRLGVRRFLLEKMVAQAIGDYEDLIGFSNRLGLSVWINCKTRVHASHRRIKQHLDPAEPFVLSVAGGNHGLANNGVHAADLFVYFDAIGDIELTAARIDPLLHPSKRGANIFDLSGTMHAHSSKGSTFTLSFAAGHFAPLLFSVTAPHYRAVVDDMVKCFYESSADSGWVWREIPFDANLSVSHMTRGFVTDILASGTCELPTLEQCFPAHKFILNSLRPYFNNIRGTSSDRCPVT